MILRSEMAQRKLGTVDLPRMARAASVVPNTVNDDDRTVDVIWSTGAGVRRMLPDGTIYIEELSLAPSAVKLGRLNNNAPLLNAHNDYECDDVIGVVVAGTAKVDGKVGTAKVRFAKAEDDPEADQIYRKVKDGILTKLSVGYDPLEMVRTNRTVDGLPVYTVTLWEPGEISVVPIPADDGATFRAADKSKFTQCVLMQQETTTMADDDKTTTSSGAAVAVDISRSLSAARIEAAKVTAEATAAAAEQAAAEELIRGTEIRSLARRWSMGDDWAENLIRARVTVDDAKTAILEMGARRDGEFNPSGAHRIAAGEDASEKFVRGATAWILERSGHTNMIAEAKKVQRLAHNFTDVSTDPGEFRGMRMTDLARAALELRRRPTTGLYGESLIRAALQTRGDQGFNTTSDFAILLETAVNKIFVGQYALAPVTWPSWAGRKSVNDFKTSTFYRPGTFGVLDSVGESGEIKHKNIPDGEKRTLTPATKANIIGITRRALANDDLGAFQNLASGLGMAAALTVESDAFALVTANSGLGINYDANPLFHTSRSNIGPTGAMSPATLDGGRATMAKQKDPSSNQFLALRPSVWLGPVELGGQAGQFNRSTTDPTDNKAQGVANRVLNLFGTIVDSPYLSAVSATRHYLLADPTLYPVFAVGFIDGREAPRIETEQSFNFDGVQMKVVLDYGTAVLDFRGAVTCAGA